MKFVETTKVIQKCLQRFLNLGKFQEAMDDNVEYWYKSETNIAKICGQCLEVLNLVCERRGREVLRELIVNLKMLLVPVIEKLMIGRHCSAKLIHSNKEATIVKLIHVHLSTLVNSWEVYIPQELNIALVDSKLVYVTF